MSGPNASIRIAAPGLDDEAVVTLVSNYMLWANDYLAREFDIHEPPADPAEIGEHLGDYREPNGQLLLAEFDGVPAGVGALRMLEADVAEVKRMYVGPQWRDRHVGSAILDHLLDEARARGARTIRLDTCQFMTAAQGLYRSRGFIERPPYQGTEIPERLQQYWIFFELKL
ncbi:MAG TPA: GNAT family N-acetyltransferase [Actinomycetes bacterium]|nr:GNAT family N-acetyltransferase [Actinomycetes bacterium]